MTQPIQFDIGNPSSPIPWPWPGPQPQPWPWPFPGPRPVPVPQPAPGPAGDVGSVGSVGVDSSTVVGAIGATGTPAAPSSSSSSPAGPTQTGDWKQFLIWIAALAGLWLILTAAQDAGYPQFANGMAGLILFGAILALGPKAFTNAQLIFQ